MFDSNISYDENSVTISETLSKKRKLNSDSNTELVHSSLSYSSFKAPPLVEYNSIDSYCEKKLGKSLLTSSSTNSKSVLNPNKIESISSPIVLKSPALPLTKRALPTHGFVPPYSFYSVEELSSVKCLKHWTNTKVCPVGRVELDKTLHHYLHSHLEKGDWKILLDTSSVGIPKLMIVVQIYGTLGIIDGSLVLKVDFFRDLESANLSLFVISYRMMQKYIPDFLNLPQKDNVDDLKSVEVVKSEVGCELNDTLDDFNLSIIDKCNNISGSGEQDL